MFSLTNVAMTPGPLYKEGISLSKGSSDTET